MERLGQIELTVRDDDPEHTGALERELVGEEAVKWLSTTISRWLPTEHPGEWNQSVAMVVLTAMDAQTHTKCQDPGCAGCSAVEVGLLNVLMLLPAALREKVLEGFERANRIDQYLKEGRN